MNITASATISDQTSWTVAWWIGFGIGVLFTWSLVAFIPAALARAKGRSFAFWYAAGFLLSVLPVLVLIFLPTHECPWCRQVVRPGAMLCGHCRSDVRADSIELQPAR